MMLDFIDITIWPATVVIVALIFAYVFDGR